MAPSRTHIKVVSHPVLLLLLLIRVSLHLVLRLPASLCTQLVLNRRSESICTGRIKRIGCGHGAHRLPSENASASRINALRAESWIEHAWLAHGCAENTSVLPLHGRHRRIDRSWLISKQALGSRVRNRGAWIDLCRQPLRLLQATLCACIHASASQCGLATKQASARCSAGHASRGRTTEQAFALHSCC